MCTPLKQEKWIGRALPLLLGKEGLLAAENLEELLQRSVGLMQVLANGRFEVVQHDRILFHAPFHDHIEAKKLLVHLHVCDIIPIDQKMLLLNKDSFKNKIDK